MSGEEKKTPPTVGQRKEMLGLLVADSFKRMATNRSTDYRAQQMDKCLGWLEELTQIYENQPEAWLQTP